MRVTLTESGGWTNVRRRCSVDTRTLPADVAGTLERCVLVVLASEPAQAPHARDAVTLVLEVEADEGSRRASFSEAAAPAEIRPVLEILRPLCRPVANVVR